MNNKNSFLIIINICHYLINNLIDFENAYKNQISLLIRTKIYNLINNKVNFLKEDKYILEMTKLTFLEC